MEAGLCTFAGCGDGGQIPWIMTALVLRSVGNCEGRSGETCKTQRTRGCVWMCGLRYPSPQRHQKRAEWIKTGGSVARGISESGKLHLAIKTGFDARSSVLFGRSLGWRCVGGVVPRFVHCSHPSRSTVCPAILLEVTRSGCIRKRVRLVTALEGHC